MGGAVKYARYAAAPFTMGTSLLPEAVDLMTPDIPKFEMPSMPQMARPPDAADAALQNAKLQERRLQLLKRGKLATLLTSPQGDTKATTTDKKTLLGE